MNDFYIDQKGLAAYFEIQWLDKLREHGNHEGLLSDSKSVPDIFIASDYYQSLALFIANTLRAEKILPATVLEVGPALGRNCFELIQEFPDISTITIVEPSQNLLANFKSILIDGVDIDFHYIKSMRETASVRFNTAPLAAACRHVDFNFIDVPFTPGVVAEQFDLTVCLNVLDQCESPTAIIEGLMQATASSGVLVVSCSYQWQKKHLKDASEAVSDINSYFGSGWRKLAEAEHEYKIRVNERYVMLFLTHVVAYRRESPILDRYPILQDAK